ncbi:MAG: hypothetical protein M1831_001354 [Alyxoria varia]|nr:MAG: hypothetical protein M1831_001354 [Alyxoria varia]
MPRFSWKPPRHRLSSNQDAAERSRSEPQLNRPRDQQPEGTSSHLPQIPPAADTRRNREDNANTPWMHRHYNSLQLPAGRCTPPPRPEHVPSFSPEVLIESDDSEPSSSAGYGLGSEATFTERSQEQAQARRRELRTRLELGVEIPHSTRPAPVHMPPSNQADPRPSPKAKQFALSSETRESWTEFLEQSAGSYNRSPPRRTDGNTYSQGVDPDSPVSSSPELLGSTPGPSRPTQRQRGALADESVRVGKAVAVTICRPGHAQLVYIERSSGDSEGEQDSTDESSNYSEVSVVFSEENGVSIPGTPPSIEHYRMLVLEHKRVSSNDCGLDDKR